MTAPEALPEELLPAPEAPVGELLAATVLAGVLALGVDDAAELELDELPDDAE